MPWPSLLYRLMSGIGVLNLDLFKTSSVACVIQAPGFRGKFRGLLAGYAVVIWYMLLVWLLGRLIAIRRALAAGPRAHAQG